MKHSRIAQVAARSTALAMTCAGLAGCGFGQQLTKNAALESTFAGQHKCEADAHDRPFIIEWDATDMATFESRAASDMVFVRYEGCTLQVVDSCADDSTPGRYGSYHPPKWTSGSVEKVHIDNSDELYAKLPLGVATFGGRVQAGVKLDMEYFVSGVATATRSTMHRGALAHNPECANATHFVYAYNLGAFSIYASEQQSAELDAEVKGVGTGGKSSRKRKSDKRGGDLAACTKSGAANSERCRVPIRLALRRIKPGEGPVREDPAGGKLAQGAVPEDTPKEIAVKLRAAAMKKAMAKDGQGCLADLDEADKLDPDPTRISTNPAGQMHLRAQCEMIKGDCAGGKLHLRKAHQTQSPHVPPDIVDDMVEQAATRFCPLSQLKGWARVDRLGKDLYHAWKKGPASQCEALGNQLIKELDKHRPPAGISQSSDLKGAYTALAWAGECLAKADQCAEGKKLMREAEKRRGRTRDLAEPGYTQRWEKRFPNCKGN